MEETGLGRLKRLAMWRCLRVWAVLGVLGAALGKEGAGGVVVAPPEGVSEGEAGVAQPLMGSVVVPSFPSTFPYMEFTDYGVLGHLAPSARPSRPSGPPSHALESRRGRLPHHTHHHRHDDEADPILQGSVPVNAYHNPTTGVKGSRWAPSASPGTPSWGSGWGGRPGSAGAFDNTLDGGGDGDGEGTLKAALNTLWSHRNDVYTSLEEDTEAVSKTWLDMLESHGRGSPLSVNHRDGGTSHAHRPGPGSAQDHRLGFGSGPAHQPAPKSDDGYHPSRSSGHQPRPKPNQASRPGVRPSQGFPPGLRTKQAFQASGSFAGEPLRPQKSSGSLKNPSQRPAVPAGGRRPILLGPSPSVGWQAGSSQKASRPQGTHADVGKVPQGAIRVSATPWTNGAAVSDRRRLHVGSATPLQMVRIRQPVSQAGLALQQGAKKNGRPLPYLPNGRPSGVGFTNAGTHGVRMQPFLTPSRLGLASTSFHGGSNWMRRQDVGGDAGSTGSIGSIDGTKMADTGSGFLAGESHVPVGHKGFRNGQTGLTEEQMILMSDLMTGQTDMMSGQGGYMTGQTGMTGPGDMTYTGLQNAANTETRVTSNDRNWMTSVSEMMHGVSQQLPSIDQAVTTMSFLAFGIFMANLVVQAVANSSSISLLGREGSNSFGGLGDFPLDFSNLDFDLGLGFGRENGLDEQDKKDILKETADVIKEVYVGLHQMAKLSVAHLAGALGTEATRSRVPPGAEGLPPECLRLLLCEGHRATSPFFRGSASYKLLPFWTVGVSWLSGETNVPRLLEDLRAEVAGQGGLDCPALYPECEDVGAVKRIVGQVVSQLEDVGMVLGEDEGRGRNGGDRRDGEEFAEESDGETEMLSTSSYDYDDEDDLSIAGGGSYDS